MMTNLFSIFDPTSSLVNTKLNWISMIIIFNFIPMNFWLMNSRMIKISKFIMKLLFNEMNQLIKMKSPIIIFISMMILIFMNNFMGLMPYIFTVTSHIMITFSMALFFWMSFNIYGWMMNTNSMLISLVPMGTPKMLMPFMVVIETISNMIRPLTLSVRLMANMTAGHLLISLMSSTCEKMNNLFYLSTIIMMQTLLMLLELAVALIQAYVFTTLLSLYYNEMNYV